MSRFFIDRPIFASVLSIVITLAGAISLVVLPLALYPPVSPPNVTVDCKFPGASAQVVAETIAAPIEQQVNGVEGMLYMSSQCTNDGSYNLTITFRHGMDLHMAQVLVQNRIALAMPLLPDVIKQAGVTTRKRSPDILMAIALNSPAGLYDQLYLSNFAMMKVKEELARLPGVSDISMLGQQDYSMRIWLDPDKLASRNMTADDVVRALREQNMQIATGQIGQPPVPNGQSLQVTISLLGRLIDPEQFGDIIVKVGDRVTPPMVSTTSAEAAPPGLAEPPSAAPVTGAAGGQGASDPLQALGTTTSAMSLPQSGGTSTPVATSPLAATSTTTTTTTTGAGTGAGGTTATAAGSTNGMVSSQVTGSTSGMTSSAIRVGSTTPATAAATAAATGTSGGAPTGFAMTPGVAGSTPGGLTAPARRSRSTSQAAANGTSTGTMAAALAPATSAADRPWSFVRLRDVARVEMAAKTEDISCRVNGKPSVSLAIFQLPDANALDTADIVKAKMAELAKDFPPGLRYEIRYDTTPYIRESISEVFKTLEESIILVAVVVLLFLQNWRSAVIPLIAVPVAIVGTFAVMLALDFSLNNLTLFGLVLAIGIVVDDAIVVVESVEHHIDHGLPPREATIVAMREVSGPVIAIGLVLSAVFVPCAFISGIVGQFFRQFALTIAASTLISTVNSLTLSPALAAVLLKPKPEGRRRMADPLPTLAIALIAGWASFEFFGARLQGLLEARLPALAIDPGWLATGLAAAAGGLAGWVCARLINRLLAWFFTSFNASFRWATRVYTRCVAILLRGTILVLVAYGGLLWLTYHGFMTTPNGFIPSQDMGYLLVNVQLPDSAALERTKEVLDRIERISHTIPGVRHSQSMAGQSMLLSAYGSNFGSMFLILDDFSERHSPDLYVEAIMGKLRRKFAEAIPEATITILPPPPVRGVGRAGGFKLMVEDRGDNGLATLQGQTENLTERASHEPNLVGMTSVFRANVPQLFVDVNRAECMSKQVSPQDLFDTLQVYLGSLYVNDFNRFGRTWQVIVQADARFRNGVEDVKRLKVRNAQGQMVPIGSLATIREINGPLILTRYNMYSAAPINGSAAQGTSSGEAITTMEQLARGELLPSMAIEWTELAYLQLQAGNTAMLVFGFAVVMVFLVLAAQYESWALPMAVILVVPLCLLCSIAGVNLVGQDINIFTQIGFVVLVGLACKNAILIVEFARGQRMTGMPRRDAVLEACSLRLRPIIMTSVAFILGVVPLLVSQGAGAEMRRTLGTTVFSGMLGVTLFGILLTPVFFVIVDWVSDTPVFRSRLARKIGSMSLGIFALGYLRGGATRVGRIIRAGRPSTQPVRRRLTRPEPVETGAGNGANGHNGDHPALPRPATAAAPEVPTPTSNGNGNGNGAHENGSPATGPGHDSFIEQD